MGWVDDDSIKITFRAYKPKILCSTFVTISPSLSASLSEDQIMFGISIVKSRQAADVVRAVASQFCAQGELMNFAPPQGRREKLVSGGAARNI
jgi:hypothetical protein